MTVNRFRRPVPPPMSHDFGKQPYVTDLNNVTMRNNNFRTAIWTGANLQMTLMSINPNQDVGLEVHSDVDQFFYIVNGVALVLMGEEKNSLNYRRTAVNGNGIFIPAGTWHNVVNAGNVQLKMFTIYAPPEHPMGTVEHGNPGYAPRQAVGEPVGGEEI